MKLEVIIDDLTEVVSSGPEAWPGEAQREYAMVETPSH
jgi:hypothetical protein